MKLLCYLLVLTSFSIHVYAQTDIQQISYKKIDSLLINEYSKGDYTKAIYFTQLGRDKAAAEFGNKDSLYAAYSSNLGLFYSIIGQVEKAEKLYLEVLTIHKNIFGEKHIKYASISNKLGVFYNNSGDFKKAKTLYLKALEIYKKKLGDQHPTYLIGLNNLASLYNDLADYTKAEKLYLEVILIYKKTKKEADSNYGTALMNLGSIYHQTGQYKKAEALLLETKEIWQKTWGETHPQFVLILNHLGGLYQDMGSYEKAETFLLQVVANDKKVLGDLDPYYAMSLNNLGGLYSEMGNYQKAAILYQKASKVNLKIFGKNHPKYLTNLGNVATISRQLGNYKKSKALSQKALEISLALYGDSHPTFGRHLEHLAKDYSCTGDYKKAEELLLRATEIHVKTLGEENINYAQVMGSLALVYQSMGQLDQAFECGLRSIDANSPDVDRSFFEPQSLDISKLATVEYISDFQINKSFKLLLSITDDQYKKTGDETKLAQHYLIAQTAMKLNERIRNSLAGDKDKLRTLTTNTFFIKNGIRAALSLNKEIHTEEAFRFAELNKSILLLDAIKGNRARSLGNLPDSLVNQEVLLQKKKTTLKKQYYESKTPEETTKINKELSEVQLETDSFLKLIKKQHPKYHHLKYSNITVNAKEIQVSLDDKTLLLEYFLTDSLAYLFAVSKNKVELYPIHVNLKQLKKQIKLLHNVLSNYNLITNNKFKSYQTYTQTAHWFYKNILGFALIEKSVENLIIITDGELGHLPFETFLTAPPKSQKSNYKDLNYLMNDYNISYNYSATLWKENVNNSERKNNGKILAYAPDYLTVDSSLLQLRSPYYYDLRTTLSPIPATIDEINSLSKRFQGSFLQGNAANEANFKKHVSNYSVIHLAMHSILDNRTPMLSSLAFTENRDSLENNFLQAYEIARLNLNADLVVLPACETGYGKFEQGEGVVSLSRSFMYAGVPSLVVSLWQVNDMSTAVVMEAFYINLASGMNKAEALRQAKISYLQKTDGIAAHPAFWSPFIQMGNTTAISIKRKRNPMTWVIGLGIFVLLGGLGLFLKRKNNASV